MEIVVKAREWDRTTHRQARLCSDHLGEIWWRDFTQRSTDKSSPQQRWWPGDRLCPSTVCSCPLDAHISAKTRELSRYPGNVY